MKIAVFFEDTQKLFIAAILALVISLTGYSQAERNEVADPSAFQKIENTGNVPLCRNSLKKCGEAALVALDLAGFGGSEKLNFKVETFVFNKVAIYLFSITGFEDDSVFGERLRVSFPKNGKVYKFVQIGRQFQCRRGEKSGKWTKNLCL